MRAVVLRYADAIRRLFDRLAGKYTAVVVVAVLGAASMAVGLLQQRFVSGGGELPVSLARLEVTFDAQRFAILLDGEGDLARRVVLSFVTWDLLFPFLYAAAFAALFYWTERWRRIDARDGALPTVSPSQQRDLLILAPIVAGILDLIIENIPLFFAGWSILADSTQSGAWWVQALVWIGSAGAALKWILLLLFLLGTLRELVAGPRGVVLWSIRFSVAAVLLGGVPLLATAQGQDILQHLVEGEHPLLRVVSAVAGMTFATLAVWYCGRKLVQMKFPGQSLPIGPDGWYMFFAEHLPRMIGIALLAMCGTAFAREGLALPRFAIAAVLGYLLALLVARFGAAFLTVVGNLLTWSRWKSIEGFSLRIGRSLLAMVIGIAIWFPLAPRWDLRSLRFAAWLCLCAAWLFYLYVYFRRERRAVANGAAPVQANERWPAVMSTPAGALSPQLKLGVAIAAGVSGVVFLLFTFWSVPVARALSPVWVVALTSANAVFIGSITVWFGRMYRVPVVKVSLVLALLFSIWNDNHDIRTLPGSGGLPPRTSIVEDFDAWVKTVAALPHPAVNNQPPEVPVVLVAAAGGGLRAAYWTAAALATLQDKTPAFGSHLYAISGVSGGSLGGGLFTALLRDANEGPSQPDCSRNRRTYVECVHAFMEDDFLSPGLAKLVGPDFLQWFLPGPIPAFDRSRALEMSWEDSYRATTKRETFAQGFLGLTNGTTPRPLAPLLFLNATSVETGRRSIASQVTRRDGPGESFLDSYDTLSVVASDMPLSTAIHNSARFTYISPAGHVAYRRGGEQHGHVVDGGYFENSGLATLREIYDVVLKYEPPTDAVTKQPLFSLRPMVLYLCNDPGQCAKDLQPLSDVVPSTAADELLSPVWTALNTREARGSLARADLHQLLKEHFLQLNVCGKQSGPPPARTDGKDEMNQQRAERTISPPLGWLLSKLARDWMDWSLEGKTDEGIDVSCAEQNVDAIRRLKTVLGG